MPFSYKEKPETNDFTLVSGLYCMYEHLRKENDNTVKSYELKKSTTFSLNVKFPSEYGLPQWL